MAHKNVSRRSGAAFPRNRYRRFWFSSTAPGPAVRVCPFRNAPSLSSTAKNGPRQSVAKKNVLLRVTRILLCEYYEYKIGHDRDNNYNLLKNALLLPILIR